MTAATATAGNYGTFQARFTLDIMKKTPDVAEKDFFVEGWATTNNIDFEDDVFDASAMDDIAAGLLLSPTVFYNHDYNQPVGKVVESVIVSICGSVPVCDATELIVLPLVSHVVTVGIDEFVRADIHNGDHIDVAWMIPSVFSVDIRSGST